MLMGKGPESDAIPAEVFKSDRPPLIRKVTIELLQLNCKCKTPKNKNLKVLPFCKSTRKSRTSGYITTTEGRIVLFSVVLKILF